MPHPAMSTNVTNWRSGIFSIDTPAKFSELALEIFHFQSKKNPVYAQYLNLLKVDIGKVNSLNKIPFLPIGFFKNHQILVDGATPEVVFESSGTTGQIPSRHPVADTSLYKESFTKCFELFFGNPAEYCVLALLPSYLERKNSSLVFMADELIKMSNHPLSGFFLDDYHELDRRLKTLGEQGQKTLLLGVSFALLDFAEHFPQQLKHTIVMETGGMKGRRAEVTRVELHSILKSAFGLERIHSEYGMTELLSQAYSKGEGIFKTPSWMKILIRNPQDPFEFFPSGVTGGINIIDLANIYSCAFIQTDDLGKVHPDNTFEVLGRMDDSELRGCNLMLE